MILNFKYVFSNPTSLMFIIFIVMFAGILAMIFTPLEFAFSIIMYTGAILPASIIYISTTFNYKHSTLYTNNKITKNNKYSFHLTSFLIMFITIYSLAFITLIELSILNNFNLLLSGWAKYPDTSYYDILGIDLGVFIYSLFELTIITFGTLFFLQEIIKSQKTIYIIILGIYILVIIYGGVFNNYFANQNLAPELGFSEDVRVPEYRANYINNLLFYPLMFTLPFFVPLQHMAFMKWSVATRHTFDVMFFIWLPSDIFDYSTRWNIMWFIPYIHTILFGVMGVVISKVR